MDFSVTDRRERHQGHVETVEESPAFNPVERNGTHDEKYGNQNQQQQNSLYRGFHAFFISLHPIETVRWSWQYCRSRTRIGHNVA
jgi:hypothetical protein